MNRKHMVYSALTVVKVLGISMIAVAINSQNLEMSAILTGIGGFIYAFSDSTQGSLVYR